MTHVVTDARDTSTELAERRTGMSFQRTRLSADRTLMAMIRTSLALISFGFTIHQFLQRTPAARLREHGMNAARNFGLALVLIGLGLLAAGGVYHVWFMTELRRERDRMEEERLIQGDSSFPVSPTLIVAGLLFVVGLLATIGIGFGIGPFR
jgi:putative membrane protein